ncbi:hypothetical protein HPB49_010443 [Dermacentor silvarum]|uniref:Uncharacterized protein n=1 Tax=Dermacentor silvarum TaxID=543639 RepID=A0ACB8C8P1_DERSI|nr:hypothetical protein HPB49_010443 [Dermacentor silvarum]
MGKDSAKNAGKDAEKDAADAKDLKELSKAFENFKRDFRIEMREIKDSITFCSETCSEVKVAATDIKNMRAEMQELIRQNMELKAENKKLSQKCDELEQYQRLNNLEIKGVPMGNDPVAVVTKIGEAVGTTIDPADIDTCHWIHTPKRVIWNPWVSGAASMADFGDDEYVKMVCVEPGYVSEPKKLPPSQNFEASVTMETVE